MFGVEKMGNFKSKNDAKTDLNSEQLVASQTNKLKPVLDKLEERGILDLSLMTISESGSPSELSILCEALRSNSSITHLDVSKTDLSTSGALDLIAASLSHQPNRLTKLNLSRLNSSSQITSLLSKLSNPSTLTTISTLTTLCLRGSCIDQEGFQSVSKIIVSCPLQELFMSEMQMKASDVLILCAALESQSNILMKLDLHFNFIRDEGLGHIVTALQGNRTITYLDLSDCGLTSAGTLNIASNLLNCGIPLSSLCLRLNYIYNWTHFVDPYLIDNTTLTSLDISGNAWDESISIPDNRSSHAFSKLLRSNSTLRSLNFVGCGLGEDALAQLARGLNENTTLEEMFLGSRAHMSRFDHYAQIDQYLVRNKEYLAADFLLK